ncbi:MAG: hypothetical protein AAGH53_09905 [Pseudomonadota bacterium]
MEGQILGFDGDKGAISGEDGNRYSFELAEWKGERPPKVQDKVDFIGKDGTASEIYLTSASLGAALSSVGGNIGEKLGNVEIGDDKLAFITTRPQLLVEIIAILSTIFLNFVVVRNESATALALGGKLDDIADSLGIFGAGDGFGVASFFAYFLWLIPVVAGIAIYREIAGSRSKKLEWATALLCLFSIFVYLLVIGALESEITNAYARRLFNLEFGFGGYVLVICGILLILTATGVLKKVPGLAIKKSD